MTNQHEKHYILAAIIAIAGFSIPSTNVRAETLESNIESQTKIEPTYSEFVHGFVFLLVIATLVALSRLTGKKPQ